MKNIMQGKLLYQFQDPDILDSVEGWYIHNIEYYKVSEISSEKIKSGNFNLQEGDTVNFELETNCTIKNNGAKHSIVASILFEDKQSSKVFLIDIDGTICEDIRNEESHLYQSAKVFPESLRIINKWFEEGNVITFFTARESKDREVTEKWLKEHSFKYHALVMDKPRIQEGQEYVWIDNKKVRAITYMGTWSELKEVDARIKVFE